jgi:hypothetical protein
VVSRKERELEGWEEEEMARGMAVPPEVEGMEWAGGGRGRLVVRLCERREGVVGVVW